MSGAKFAEKSARMVRAFKIATPDNLVQVRAVKVNAELDKLRAAVKQLAAEGLCLASLSAALQTQEQAVAACVNLKNEKKCDALETIKTDARAAVAAAAKDAPLLLRKWKEQVSVQVAKAAHFSKLGQQEATKKDADPTKLAWLVQPAATLAPGIAALQSTKGIDAKAAFSTWDRTWGPFETGALVDYQKKISAPPLIAKADLAKKQDPGGAEAVLEKLFDRDVFEQKLGRMALTAEAFDQDLSKLGVGDALAVAEYSGGFYIDINNVLLGKPIPDTDGSQTAKANKIAELTVAAMEKLPAHKNKFTRRGESDWPGAAEQFKAGNVFVLKIFWSTGDGFTFPGLYQINVIGKSGKNISAFSDHPHESEVLFPPGTKFKVMKNIVTDVDPKTEMPTRIEVTVQEQ